MTDKRIILIDNREYYLHCKWVALCLIFFSFFFFFLIIKTILERRAFLNIEFDSVNMNTRLMIEQGFQLNLRFMSTTTTADEGTLILLLDAWQVRVIAMSDRLKFGNRSVLRTRPWKALSEVASNKRFSLHQVTLASGWPFDLISFFLLW